MNDRILVVRCSGDCRNLHILKEPIDDLETGYYCSGFGGWEKINPDDCKICTEKKKLQGISYKEALEIGAYALAQQRYWEHADAIQMANSLGWKECERDAEIVLNALIKQKEN